MKPKTAFLDIFRTDNSDLLFALFGSLSALIFLSGVKISLFSGAWVVLMIASFFIASIQLTKKHKSAILSFLPAVAFPQAAVLIACLFPFLLGLLLSTKTEIKITNQYDLRSGLAVSLGLESQTPLQFRSVHKGLISLPYFLLVSLGLYSICRNFDWAQHGLLGALLFQAWLGAAKTIELKKGANS